MIASFLALVLLCVGFPDHARAQVVLTFAAKRAEGTLGIPHSYLRITGTSESGEGIRRTFGYVPVEESSFLALGDRVRGAVIDETEARIEWERVSPFLSVQVPDTTLDAVIVRFRYWNENRNGGYDAYVQNCIAFLADIARTVGLKVPPGSHLSPSGFMRELVEINPPGSHPGILAEPVANPLLQEQTDLPSSAVPEGEAAKAPEPPPGTVPAQPGPTVT